MRRPIIRSSNINAGSALYASIEWQLIIQVTQPVERVTVDHEAASSTLVRQPILRPDGVVGLTHWTLNPEIAGSNPVRAANVRRVRGVGRPHLPVTQRIAGSNPVHAAI